MAQVTHSLTVDDIARALGVDADALGAALDRVGVDADYLERALSEGDPQRVLDDLARVLGRRAAEVLLALSDAAGMDADAVASVAERMDLDAEEVAVAMERRAIRGILDELGVGAAATGLGWLPALGRAAQAVPRALRALTVAAALVGVLLAGAGAAALLYPAAARAILWYALAGGLVLAGAGVLAAAATASGFAAAQRRRVERVRERARENPAGLAADAARRAGVDERARAAVVRGALRVAAGRGAAPSRKE